MCTAIPLSHSCRVSWGPGGLIAFGTRSVRITSLKALGGMCGPDGDSSAVAARAEASLRVFKKAQDTVPVLALALETDAHPQLPENAARALAERLLAHKESSLRASIEAGAETGVQNFLVEQHVWKAVAALLFDRMSHTSAQDEDSEAQDEDSKSVLLARRREALLGWLRLAMWDAAAARVDELNKSGDTPETKKRKKLWAMATALQHGEAVESALEGGHAYLATLLAQPAQYIQDDLRKQLEELRRLGESEGGGAGGELPLDAESLPMWLSRLLRLLSGGVSEAKSRVMGRAPTPSQ